MNYCSQCGHQVDIRIPEGDNRPRHVCPSCSTIHYSNPRVISGCLPIYEDQVLLCKRSIEPRHGYWTLPAGFLENGETTEEGALRETLEESLAEVEIISLYTFTSIVHVNQVHLFYLARMSEPQFGPTNESSEVRLFNEQEIPWDQIAFTTVKNTLERFFEDRRQTGSFPLHRMGISRELESQNFSLEQRDTRL